MVFFGQRITVEYGKNPSRQRSGERGLLSRNRALLSGLGSLKRWEVKEVFLNAVGRFEVGSLDLDDRGGGSVDFATREGMLTAIRELNGVYVKRWKIYVQEDRQRISLSSLSEDTEEESGYKAWRFYERGRSKERKRSASFQRSLAQFKENQALSSRKWSGMERELYGPLEEAKGRYPVDELIHGVGKTTLYQTERNISISSTREGEECEFEGMVSLSSTRGIGRFPVVELIHGWGQAAEEGRDTGTSRRVLYPFVEKPMHYMEKRETYLFPLAAGITGISENGRCLLDHIVRLVRVTLTRGRVGRRLRSPSKDWRETSPRKNERVVRETSMSSSQNGAHSSNESEWISTASEDIRAEVGKQSSEFSRSPRRRETRSVSKSDRSSHSSDESDREEIERYSETGKGHLTRGRVGRRLRSPSKDWRETSPRKNERVVRETSMSSSQNGAHSSNKSEWIRTASEDMGGEVGKQSSEFSRFQRRRGTRSVSKSDRSSHSSDESDREEIVWKHSSRSPINEAPGIYVSDEERDRDMRKPSPQKSNEENAVVNEVTINMSPSPEYYFSETSTVKEVTVDASAEKEKGEGLWFTKVEECLAFVAEGKR
ncbi:hypothetical protein BC829DRAFT_403431, partial [Chytridium lagenaria]